MKKTHLFNDLDYESYNKKNKINELVGIDLENYGDLDSKQIRFLFSYFG